MDSVVFLNDVAKSYPPNRRALTHVQLSVQEGAFMAVLGGPGSGKTTLMRLVCGLTPPSGGSVTVLGRDLALMGEKQRADFWNAHMGIVLREPVFLEGLTVAENAALSLIAGGADIRSAVLKAKGLLKSFGLEKRAESPVGALSPLDRHMVQLARAAVCGPEVLLLDEPGASLDGREKDRLMENLRALSCSGRCTVLCFTADRRLAERFRQTVLLQDGEIVKE